MASTTIHKKPNGKAYVYSVESYWDKEKKAPRNRQKCIGRLDEATGQVLPTKKRHRAQSVDTAPASEGQPDQSLGTKSKVIGPHVLLTKVANDIGLTQALKKSFPETYKLILSLAFFIAQKGSALSRCETWSNSHCHPQDEPITSQSISELLKRPNEDSRQHFLAHWLKRLSETELLCYDLTSISSYATGNEFVRRGYNRDGENLPQINLAMLFGQRTGLPAYYRRLPGNITDTKTLQTTMKTLDFLGQSKLSVVLDRGFYSEQNIQALLRKRFRFFIAVPKGRLWVRSIIDQHKDEIASPRQYKQVGDTEVLYIPSPIHYINRRRCYVHLYYNSTRAAEDYDRFIKKLISCKGELESGNRNEKNKDLYERYFHVRESAKGTIGVDYNDDEIRAYKNRYAGFFCILTNVRADSDEVLDIYRRKDVVENCFDDLKNALDMKRLRIHSSSAMDSRLFIQFLALSLLSRIRTVSREHKSLKHKTAREIIETMETLTRISYSSRATPIITEAGPAERNIIDAFALDRWT
ncbi:MAG: IS1634 family transposase [Polyangiaceae bacterium]|nr:IS1634 family transposase [Polyangiaceae bacterium]